MHPPCKSETSLLQTEASIKSTNNRRRQQAIIFFSKFGAVMYATEPIYFLPHGILLTQLMHWLR